MINILIHPFMWPAGTLGGALSIMPLIIVIQFALMTRRKGLAGDGLVSANFSMG